MYNVIRGIFLYAGERPFLRLMSGSANRQPLLIVVFQKRGRSPSADMEYTSLNVTQVDVFLPQAKPKV